MHYESTLYKDSDLFVSMTLGVRLHTVYMISFENHVLSFMYFLWDTLSCFVQNFEKNNNHVLDVFTHCLPTDPPHTEHNFYSNW